MDIKAEEILWNEESFFWLIDGEIRSGKLNYNSHLQDLAEFLFFEYHTERTDYRTVEFLFQETIYNDNNLRLADIKMSSDYLIEVKKNIIPLFTRTSCSLSDRDNNIDQRDGIRFELLLKNKIIFVFKSCLSIFKKTGITFIKTLRHRLADTDNKFEINAIQQTMDEIQELTQNYLTDVRKSLGKIF